MHQNSVFQKSAKGSQAIATRDHALAPKLRSMLILVDGKRSVEELAKLSAALGDPHQLLAQLQLEGYVEDVSTAAPAPVAASVAAPAPAAPSRPAVSLAEAQRAAVRKLTDLLGPTAEDMCLRIEGTRTAAEFHAAVKRAEAMVRDINGAAAASAFAHEVETHRPG